MCLDTYHDEPKIADRDITAYKVVKAPMYAKYYISPYRGEMYMNRDIKDSKLGTYQAFLYGSAYTVVEEGLHTICSKKEAFNLASQFTNGAVMKCIIPKGTKYFEGRFSRAYNSYASARLVVGRRIGYNWLSDLYHRFTGH